MSSIIPLALGTASFTISFAIAFVVSRAAREPEDGSFYSYVAYSLSIGVTLLVSLLILVVGFHDAGKEGAVETLSAEFTEMSISSNDMVHVTTADGEVEFSSHSAEFVIGDGSFPNPTVVQTEYYNPVIGMTVTNSTVYLPKDDEEASA